MSCQIITTRAINSNVPNGPITGTLIERHENGRLVWRRFIADDNGEVSEDRVSRDPWSGCFVVTVTAPAEG